jgi:hypothetical protein
MHGVYVMYVGSITKKQDEETEGMFGWEYMHINTYLDMHGMYVIHICMLYLYVTYINY